VVTLTLLTTYAVTSPFLANLGLAVDSLKKPVGAWALSSGIALHVV